MGYSKTDLFFSLLVRSRGAPPVHVYPPRRTLSAAPWTYMSGGRFLTSSQFFGSLDPFRCRTFNIYYTYITWYELFSQSSSGVATSVVITRILLPIWIYRNVIHVEDMYGIYCSFSVYIRIRVVPCLGKRHLFISTNKNVDVISC